VVAVAVAVDVAAAVLGTVGLVEGVVRVEEVVAETAEVAKVAEMLVVEEGVVRVKEVEAETAEVEKVAGLLVVEEGVVMVEEVVAETVEVNKVAELLVAEEGMGREVGGGARRSNTQSNCIPSCLNTRMTGSPRMNRRLSAGMENGKHARAVATVAVEVADSAAWGAMAEEDDRGLASRASCESDFRAPERAPLRDQ